MLRLPDTGFERLISPVSINAGELWRFSKFPATEPYWARNGQHRFDDPAGLARGAASFGVLYAAELPEVAFCESVIHENSLFERGTFLVARSALAERSLVGFNHPTSPTLSLADLTGAALKKLGLNNDISSGADYTVPQAWAKAIHVACPGLDGIRYVSRQLNTGYCYALFDRCGVAVDTAAELSTAVLDTLCVRYNVTPV